MHTYLLASLLKSAQTFAARFVKRRKLTSLRAMIASIARVSSGERIDSSRVAVSRFGMLELITRSRNQREKLA